jgi:hypothetical protein
MEAQARDRRDGSADGGGDDDDDGELTVWQAVGFTVLASAVLVVCRGTALFRPSCPASIIRSVCIIRGRSMINDQ